MFSSAGDDREVSSTKKGVVPTTSGEDEHEQTRAREPGTVEQLLADYTAACRADRADRARLLRSVAEVAAQLAADLGDDAVSRDTVRELARTAREHAREEQRARIAEARVQASAEHRAQIGKGFDREPDTPPPDRSDG